jgi:hypothetical protein
VNLASDDDRPNGDRSLSPDLLASSPESSPPRARFRRNNNDGLSHGSTGGRAAPLLSPARRDRQQQSVISLVQSPDASNRSNRRNSSNNETTRNFSNMTNQQWTCTRCTLINPTSQTRCSACEATRQLDDDEIIFQRTTNSSYQRNQGASTSHFVGGGAFIGGMLGAAGAYANGTGVARGVIGGQLAVQSGEHCMEKFHGLLLPLQRRQLLVQIIELHDRILCMLLRRMMDGAINPITQSITIDCIWNAATATTFLIT